MGHAGEKLVFEYECERLNKAGRADLSARVRWHTQNCEFPGWEITSYDTNGNEMFIEVKSSAGKLISCVDLTVNEWEAACDAARQNSYYLYIVTEALSATPRIERLHNPASYVTGKMLSCEAIVYELRLSQTDLAESTAEAATGASN